MNIVHLLRQGEKILKDNSPAILTALGVSGTVTTAYLAGKASFAAAKKLGDDAENMTPKEKAVVVWRLYIPAGISGVITVGCIISATRINSKRAAAAYSILTVSEKAFDEYREKVVERLGERKEKEVRDEIAQDHVNRKPIEQIIMTGAGNVLCFEMLTGRYFNSDMETLRKAQNDVNFRLVNELYVPICDFYYLIGLPYTSNSGQIGWTSGKLMNLEFTTTMSEDSRPCLAFEYNYIKQI